MVCAPVKFKLGSSGSTQSTESFPHTDWDIRRRGESMKTKIFYFAASAILVILATTSNLRAQDAPTKVSYLQLTAGGNTSLGTPVLGDIAKDDLRVKRSHDFDITRLMEPRLSLAVSQFPEPKAQVIAPLASMSFGFPGLTHRDQRLAGTGIYADSQFNLEPPDQGLAAGKGFILEAVNDALAVFDQHTGSRLAGPTPLNQFFQLAPEIIRSTPPVYGDFVSDPRCYFDSQLQRWFIVALQIDVDRRTGDFANSSHLLIAVSATSDPTLGFRLFKLDVTNDGSRSCPCFGDQPLIGADANGFYITTNAFSLVTGGYGGVQLYAMSKKALGSGIMPTVVHLSGLTVAGGFAFSVQPATSPSLQEEDEDRNPGVEFFMSTFNITRVFNDQVTVWALTNTRSLREFAPNLKLRNVSINSEVYAIPPDAEQKAGPIPLGKLFGESEELVATNEHRMQQVVFAEGKLWSAVTTALKNGPNILAGIAYFVVEPSWEHGQLAAQMENQGYVAVKDNNLFFPSMGVTKEGKAVMTFSLSGRDYFPSVAFTKMDSENGAGSVQIAALGAAPEDGFSGYQAFGGAGSGRWGDYSAAVADGNTVWFAAEYIPNSPRTILANWGTFIGKVRTKGREDEN